MTGVHSLMSPSLLGLLLILVFLVLSRAVVHEHPATQVVAAGQNTRFNCTASGRSFIWIITIPGHSTHLLEADGEPFQGFTPIDSPIPPDDNGRHEYGMFTLVAEGRIENNNTRVCCVVQIHSGGSSACPEQPDQAHLIVIGVPSEPGNLTVVVEKDNLIVRWTAPYAHPGYSILSYTLQINNSESVGSIQTELSGNSTEDVVNITKIGSDCDVLTVSLTACNRVGMGSPAISEVTLPILVVGNVSCDVHCQLLDQDHATVNVIIKFPQLCLQQQFKYNVILKEEGANEVIAHESAMAFYSGSNLLNISFGSEVIKIDSDYRLTVQFKTPVTYVSSSTLCTFNTYVNKTMMNADRGTHELIIQVAIGCTGGLALALSAVLLVLTVLLTICCKRRRSIQGTIRRASNMQQSMAENPIYDSPLYESIQEHLRPVFCHPRVQESLYTESPVCTYSSSGQSVRDMKKEETARPCLSLHCAMQSCGDRDSDSGKGGAGGSKTCDDGYVPMQSICTKDDL